MANIANNVDLQTHREAPADVFFPQNPQNPADNVFQFQGINDGVISNNSTFYAASFGSNFNTSDLNLGIDTTLFITDSANVPWAGGTLRAENSFFIFCYTTGAANWPGFNTVVNNGATSNPRNGPGYNMVIPGCVFRLNQDALTAGVNFTTHFDGMALGGNDFNGVRFENGQLIAPYGALPFVNITYSGDSAADGFTNAALSYRRAGAFNKNEGQPTEILVPNIWAGDFGCDFRNWTDTDIVSSFGANQARVAQAAVTKGRIDWYLIDGQFSQNWLNTGFSFSVDGRATENSLPFRVIRGRSWNPQFHQEFTTTDIQDVIFDVGTANDIILPGTTSDVTVEPTRVETSTGTNRYVEWYPGGSRRTGIVLIEGETDVPANGGTTPVPLSVAARTLPAWSYTHNCFTGHTIDQQTLNEGVWAGQLIMEQSRS